MEEKERGREEEGTGREAVTAERGTRTIYGLLSMWSALVMLQSALVIVWSASSVWFASRTATDLNCGDTEFNKCGLCLHWSKYGLLVSSV